MRCWCVLVGLLALTVPLASDESATTTELADTSDVFFNATTWSDDDYYYVDDNEDEHQEFLPDPEALTADEEDEEEVVVLDAETRVVAEALIQELDDLSNKLNEDDKVEEEEDKPTASAQVSPADVLKLEKLLQSAGLTPNSPLMQSLMAQRRNAIPASAAEGAPALGSLLGKAPIRPGSTVAAAAVGNSFLTPGMTKKNVEEIKLELKHMLFGPDNRRTQNQNRRQGGAVRRPARPQPTTRNPQRRPPVATGVPIQRQQHIQQRPPSQRQQRPPIPLFLRPPRPARPNGSTNPSGRPSVSSNELARQPINEFRPPASDFRLPESPFRQQIANTHFSPPARNPTANNGNSNNVAPSLRASPSGPVGPPPSQQRPSGAPRPSEDEFRPAIQNNRPSSHLQPTSKTSPPAQFQLPPPLSFRPASGSALVTQPPRQQSVPSGRPIIGGSILTQGNFDAAHNQQQAATRSRPVKPECELYTEGICLDVRNYPTEIISNYLNRNKPALETMLAEVRSQSADDLVDGVSAAEERKYSYSHYYGNRRQGEDTHAHRDFAEEGGFLCPSDVKYARPQLAQTSRGVWKYIINMGEHTQTIRMERCLKPGGGCSYVSPHYKSHCIQVYNYHRLLSFEEGKGMHVDIYKIPVGCSCHVQGYAYLYPPLDGKTAGHVIPPAFPTDNNGNALGANRKTGQPASPSSRDSFSSSLSPNFDDLPKGLKDFSSFMDQQFSGSFGPFSSKRGGSQQSQQTPNLRRVDQIGHDQEEEYVAQPSNTRKPVKTNYEYHPILDFFNDKP